jgi:hypothetical protein
MRFANCRSLIQSPQAVSNALLGAKRKFQQFLSKSSLVHGHRDEAETEIRQIKKFLSRNS